MLILEIKNQIKKTFCSKEINIHLKSSKKQFHKQKFELGK